MKSSEEVVQILEAFDLCGSYRAAGDLGGCSHHTAARYVELREGGERPEAGVRRKRLIDPYLEKVEEWVERSRGRVRADVAQRKLLAMGYGGSDRTTRRAVAEAKRAWRSGRRRVYRPWIPEPGMWLQWDFGTGPAVKGQRTYLWCAWLAWSRYRVVMPAWDKTLPTVVACLDATLRATGGVPTYGLTDNEKTVTSDHVAGIAVRNPQLVAAARHYGLTVATCVPADPETKGGSEATVRIAKADLVPTDANLRDEYGCFGELAAACAEFMEEVNNRPHRVTNRPPCEMLADERRHLHPVPQEPYTIAFGQTRSVSWSSTISYGGVRYSVPWRLAGETVWVRVEGEELVAVHVHGRRGAVEVARHRLSTPGKPQISEEHYPPRPPGALARQPRASNPEEAAFLGIGEEAHRWLVVAAAGGTARVRRKMAEAVDMAKLYGPEPVASALGVAAAAERFGEGDLASILRHRETFAGGETRTATEAHSLQRGTGAWLEVGR